VSHDKVLYKFTVTYYFTSILLVGDSGTHPSHESSGLTSPGRTDKKKTTYEAGPAARPGLEISARVDLYYCNVKVLF